jgi:hypothetical protein
VRRIPLLTLPLGLGLIVGAWALASRLITLCLGIPTADRGPAPTDAALAPAWLHLGLVLVLGLAMPSAIVAWFTAVARATQ